MKLLDSLSIQITSPQLVEILTQLQSQYSEESIQSICQYALIRGLENTTDKIPLVMHEMQNTLHDIHSRLINSKNKGTLGEDVILSSLTHAFSEDKVEVSAHIAHSGDYQITTKDGHRILIDVKLYSNPVPTKEIDKLKRDVKESGCECGVLLSLNSHISSKKRIETEPFGKGHIVYMGNAGLDGHGAIMCVLLANALMKSNKTQSHVVADRMIHKALDNAKLIQQKVQKLNSIQTQIHSLQKTQNDAFYCIYRDLNTIQADIHHSLNEFIRCEELELYHKDWINDTNDYDSLLCDLTLDSKMKYFVHCILHQLADCGVDSFSSSGPRIQFISHNSKLDGVLHILKTKVNIDMNCGLSFTIQTLSHIESCIKPLLESLK